MISYAQNCEDVLLQRFFDQEPPQFYVDVGAGHPTFHSVTKHFYDAGWCGLNIEPRSHLAVLLRTERPRDFIHHGAIADRNSHMTFYEVDVTTDRGDDRGGLSTLDHELAQKYRQQGYSVVQHELQTTTLSSLLEQFNVRDIGFLKIDVEGFEWQVVQSLDWLRWRPRVVVTESTVPTSAIICDEQVTKFLSEHGYTAVNFDGLNRYFVREEDHDRMSRLQAPVSVLDDYTTYHVWQMAKSQENMQTYIANIEQNHRHNKDELLMRCEQLSTQFALMSDQCLTLNTKYADAVNDYRELTLRMVEQNDQHEALLSKCAELKSEGYHQKLTLNEQIRKQTAIVQRQNLTLKNLSQTIAEIQVRAEQSEAKARRRTARGRIAQARNYLQHVLANSRKPITAAEPAEPTNYIARRAS